MTFLKSSTVFSLFLPVWNLIYNIHGPFVTRKMSISEKNPWWHLFFSVRTFTRIKYHYFSKYWGRTDTWAIPQVKFWGNRPSQVSTHGTEDVFHSKSQKCDLWLVLCRLVKYFSIKSVYINKEVCTLWLHKKRNIQDIFFECILNNEQKKINTHKENRSAQMAKRLITFSIYYVSCDRKL